MTQYPFPRRHRPPERTMLFVKQMQDGLWHVLREHDKRDTNPKTTELAAIRRAIRLVAVKGGGDVVVLNRSGKTVKSFSPRPARKRKVH